MRWASPRITLLLRQSGRPKCTSAPALSPNASCLPPLRYAVIGGGFAGVAVAWHLLAGARYGVRPVQLDLFDAFDLGAGGSGAAAGLLHPYTPRGKLLWYGLEAFNDAVQLVAAAEAAAGDGAEQFVWRNGLLRPARTPKQAADLAKFVHQDAGAAAATGAECVDEPRMAAAIPGLGPGLLPPRGGAGPRAVGLLVRQGLVLHPRRYLSALWAACEQQAARAGGGSSARLLRCERVASLRALHAAHGTYDAVVVAAGAAVDSVQETFGLLPLDLCQGCTLDMSPPDAADACTFFPAGAPSILGPVYIAAQGPRHLVVGATKRHGVSPAEAFAQCGAGGNPADGARAAEAQLLPPAARLWPPLEGWRVAGVRSGVRALPSRTQQGSVPYAGRVRSDAGASWWVMGGLGARGLTYHAWLGRLVAAAVLADDESGLPPELRRWQQHPAAAEAYR